MGLIKGRGMQNLGLNPPPPPFPPTVPRQQYIGFQPGATPNVQLGAWAVPPAQLYPGIWPDVQLNCGVNGLDSHYNVPGTGDVPFFQMTQRQQNPPHLLTSGNRSAGVPTQTVMSENFAPRALSQAQAQAALANGTLGF